MNRNLVTTALGLFAAAVFAGTVFVPTSSASPSETNPSSSGAENSLNHVLAHNPAWSRASLPWIQAHETPSSYPAPHGPWPPSNPPAYPIPIADEVAACDPATGKIYVADGVSNGVLVTDAYVYSPSPNSWTAIADSPVAREAPAGALIGGKFYIANGWDDTGSPVTELDIYDPASDSWSTGSDNPLPTGGGSIGAALNGKFYVVGGCYDGSCSNLSSALQIYDPASDSWTSGADYPQPVVWEMCGGIQGKLYCAGGFGTTSSYSTGYVYDPATDTWSPIADIPEDVWGAAYGVVNDKLVIAGGVTNGGMTVSNQTFIYDPATDGWTSGSNLPSTVYRAGSASCNGHLYIIGGLGGSGTTIVWP